MADMEAGRWELTGDTIKFSDAMIFRDGQNRLFACIEAGVPFETHVVFGIPDRAFVVMDRTKTRSSADVLAIAGYKNTTALYAAIRWTHLIETDRPKARDTIQPAECLSLVQTAYHDLPDYVLTGMRIYKKTGHPTGIVAALLRQFHNVNPKRAEAFSNAWETGSVGGKFKPLGLLNMAVQHIQSVSSGRVHEAVRAALIVKAWNLFVQGRKGSLSEMKWKPAEDFPVIGG